MYIIKSFNQCENKSYWNFYNGSCLCPDFTMKRPSTGRPKSMRICNEIDIKESDQPKRYGLYQNEGDNCRNCNVTGLSSQS